MKKTIMTDQKIIRQEYFPYLVENGFDTLGIILWLDYGHYFKVILKTEYEKAKTTTA
jgi:hypothetical protein